MGSPSSRGRRASRAQGPKAPIAGAVAAKELSSVWCFFAALLSAGVFAHFALARREEQSVSLAS